jgi:hypothetical protein
VVPLEAGRPDVERALGDVAKQASQARTAGVDVSQAERLLREAGVALQVGNLTAAARMVEAARRSVRDAVQRAAYIALAYGKLEADMNALKERGIDVSPMETRLAEARAVRAKDPALSRALFSAAAEGVARARRELADQKKRAILRNLPK